MGDVSRALFAARLAPPFTQQNSPASTSFAMSSDTVELLSPADHLRDSLLDCMRAVASQHHPAYTRADFSWQADEPLRRRMTAFAVDEGVSRRVSVVAVCNGSVIGYILCADYVARDVNHYWDDLRAAARLGNAEGAAYTAFKAQLEQTWRRAQTEVVPPGKVMFGITAGVLPEYGRGGLFRRLYDEVVRRGAEHGFEWYCGLNVNTVTVSFFREHWMVCSKASAFVWGDTRPLADWDMTAVIFCAPLVEHPVFRITKPNSECLNGRGLWQPPSWQELTSAGPEREHSVVVSHRAR